MFTPYVALRDFLSCILVDEGNLRKAADVSLPTLIEKYS